MWRGRIWRRARLGGGSGNRIRNQRPAGGATGRCRLLGAAAEGREDGFGLSDEFVADGESDEARRLLVDVFDELVDRGAGRCRARALDASECVLQLLRQCIGLAAVDALVGQVLDIADEVN